MAQPIICPRCGSTDIAQIQYGRPSFTEELKQGLADGSKILGGCYITEKSPRYQCNHCMSCFGLLGLASLFSTKTPHEQLCSMVYGAVVGDALGVPYDLMQRDSFMCAGMTAGGIYCQPEGTFSDQTSMLLATCDSIRQRGIIDTTDMRQRFRKWFFYGDYTADGAIFKVGYTVATALNEDQGHTDEYSDDIGALVRVAPLALTEATDEQIEEVSGITHNHPLAKQACVTYVNILKDVSNSISLIEAIEGNIPNDNHFAFMTQLAELQREDISSGGSATDTLCASLWCALHTSSYAECVLTAVNLGGDTDATACVAGALAGALYGQAGIPQKWLDELRGKDIIETSLFL